MLLLREGIVRLLGDAGFDVVAQAADAEDLLRKVAAHSPDVAIIDIQMPPTNTDDGLRAAMHVRATQPQVGVLVLSQFVEEAYALDLIGDDAAGVGYLLKDRVADVAAFTDAIRRVSRGGRRSTRRSSPRCSAARVAATRWRTCRRESARC
jgi:DNA-binding NarL/FixJ family response regulator